MASPPDSAIEAINHGIAAYRAGDQAAARSSFVQALQHDATSELAWLWLATVVTDPAEQRYCLNRAAAINPETPGQRRLARLPAGPALPPPEVRHLDKPPLPPDLEESETGPLPFLPPLPGGRHRRKAHRGNWFSRSQRAKVPAKSDDAESPEDAAGKQADDAAGTSSRAEDEAPKAPEGSPGARPRRWVPWLIGGGVLLVLAIVVAVLISRMQPGLAGEPYVIAYAGPISGVEGYVGREQLRAVRMAVNEINEAGGLGGRPVVVRPYNDENDPERAAVVAEQIVNTDDVLLVVGHHASRASLAAAPVYEAAGLPAISPSSTTDALTANNPWYFRTVIGNHDQGQLIAAYANHALGYDRASVITKPGVYEESLTGAFVDEFRQRGTVVRQWEIDPEDRDASILAIIEELAATEDPGIVFLPLSPEDAHPVLLSLRLGQLPVTVIAGDALGYQGFASMFAGEPEEELRPGYFTDDLYVVSTIIYDGLGGTALEFAQDYAALYGAEPAWFGAKAHDAAQLAIYALTRLDAEAAPPESLADARSFVRDALEADDRLATAIDGLSGPLYFDDTHTVPQMLSFGMFNRGVMLNAPYQYRPVVNFAKYNIPADEEAGLLFTLDELTFRQYRVAYVGVGINEVSNLDPRSQTFDADFYIWFWYRGDDEAENVFFPNAVETDLTLPEALERSDAGLLDHFATFRVNATFFEPLDFRDYPWDRHFLSIDMQNRTLTNDDIVYVPDPTNLQQSQAERRRSAVDADTPFNRNPNWRVESVTYNQDSALARATHPDPVTGGPEYNRFSVYRVEMEYVRIIRPFLIKNLLPLALLALVTYISLYFSPEYATTRIGFSITSILTTSVLLQSVSSNLPEIGYTVAIEWGYYVYIGLSAALVLTNIVIDRWYKKKRYAAASRLDLAARVVYPLVILAVVIVYAVQFWN